MAGSVAESAVLAPLFTFTPVQLCWILIGYGAVASVLPVWLLLAPRDYLSTFLKIGAIAALAIGIVIMAPPLRMPALTAFAAGGGPVWAGGLFPFLFITIACGAVSGFHALIASGTTPKLIASEGDAPFIGYGAILQQDRDHRADLHAVGALRDDDLADRALVDRLELHRRLVGLDLGHDVAGLDRVAFLDQPLGQRALLHRRGQRGHLDLDRHGCSS